MVSRREEDGTAVDWFRVAVRTTVETVLKGELNQPTLDYEYWMPALGTVGEWNSLQEGARYVQFLRRDRLGHWHAVVDFWPASIHVTTGRHPRTTDPVPLAIAKQLLLPGDGFDPAKFDLMIAIPKASQLIGKAPVLAMVETLAAHPDPRVRSNACFELRRLRRPTTACTP